MTGSILKISEAASIALHSMIILAKNTDRLVSVKDIAEMLGVSANHLSKVMQRLTKAGYIKSIKGFNGGFKLNYKPEDITFLDIYEAIDGKLNPCNCLLSKNECIESCIMSDLIISVNNQVKDYFKNKKLSEFVK